MFRIAYARFFVCLLLISSAILYSQQPASAPPSTEPGPVPPALLNAKSVFVSNAGADSGLFPFPFGGLAKNIPIPFTGDTNRPYNQFYAELKTAGLYQLVSDPSQADLVFELQLAAPVISGPSEGVFPLAMFRLTIYDRKTHYVLWAITESVEPAIIGKNHNRNFDEALSRVVSDLQKVAQTPSAKKP